MANELQTTQYNNKLYGKLPDTSWIELPISTADFENFSWEKLAYRKIGNVVYLHGGGKLSNLQNEKIIGQLPNGYKPRQNTAFVCARNNSSEVCTCYINYDGSLRYIARTGTASSIEFFINISFVAR